MKDNNFIEQLNKAKYKSSKSNRYLTNSSLAIKNARYNC